MRHVHVLCSLHPTLYNPMGCSPLGSSVHGDSPGKNTGVGYHVLLQGLFPIQGSNPGLLHCGQTLYWLRHQGSYELIIATFQVVKNPTANSADARKADSVSGSGRSPAVRSGNPLQCSCLEIPWTEDLAGYSPWSFRGSDTSEQMVGTWHIM